MSVQTYSAAWVVRQDQGTRRETTLSRRLFLFSLLPFATHDLRHLGSVQDQNLNSTRVIHHTPFFSPHSPCPGPDLVPRLHQLPRTVSDGQVTQLVEPLCNTFALSFCPSLP